MPHESHIFFWIGGSSAQCHSIRDQLVQFSNDNSIPLYCFAESYATHGKDKTNHFYSFLFHSSIMNDVYIFP